MMPKISPSHYFKLSNGRIIKNLEELPEALNKIDKIVFKEHVTPYKNDFAKWVYDVYRLDYLCGILGEVKSKDEIIRILFAYTNKKNKPVEQNTDEPVIRNAQEAVVKKVPKQPPLQAQPVVKKATPVSKLQLYKWKGQVKPQQPQPVGEKKKVVKQDKKPVVIKKEPKKKIEKEEKKVEEKEEPKKEKVIHNITDADEFFEKNPVIMSQVVNAKQKTLKIELLPLIEYTGDEIPKKLVEVFKDNYAKAYERMQFLRKNGFDTSLIEIMLFRIPPKIKVYDASKENKDSILVKRYLKEIIEELNNMKP